MERTAPTLDELLAHEAWLRRVVRRLVDDHEVDDVVQDTWTAALQASSAHAGTRGWLGRVAQNLALRVRRSHARRRRREAGAARPDEVPSTSAMLERIEAHRQVAETVAVLDEPYRTAVLLRYFHDMSPAQIAAHLGVEPSTVRSRLQRGLSRVRGHLERDGRDVPALAAMLLVRPPAPAAPLAAGRRGLRALLGGTTLMTVPTLWKTAGAAGLIALVAFGVRALVVNDTASAPSADPEPTARVARSTEPATDSNEPLRSSARRTPTVAPPAAETGTHAALRGRVLDRGGHGVPGVELMLEQRDDHGMTTISALGGATDDAPLIASIPLGVSGADGGFAFDDSDPRVGDLRPRGPWRALRAFTPAVERRAEEDALLVVAPAVDVSGRVLDGDGYPIARALLQPRIDGLLEFPDDLARTTSLAMSATWSDESGRFAFTALPGVPELRIDVAHDDHAGAALCELERGGVFDVVLGGRDGDAFRLRGTVVDHHGRLVADAYVALGQQIVRTDRLGAFEASTRSLTEDSAVVAGKPGLRACVDRSLAQALRDGPRDVGGVTLTIGPEALSAGGRVVDPGGAPLPGLCVTILDGMSIQALWTAEDVARGVEPRIESEGSTPMKVDARTDADGRFEIGGLDRRSYRIRLFDPVTLVAKEVPIDAGADATITFDPDARFERVNGVVSDRSGRPLADASVWVQLMTWDRGGLQLRAAGARTTTDERGRFSLTGVPRGGVQLRVSGDGLVDTDCPLLPPLGDPLTIVVLRRCAFRVALLADTDADEIALLDADGRRLALARIMGQMSTSAETWRLARGRTPVLHAREDAQTIALLRDGVEVDRRPVALDPERVTVIE